MSSTAVPLRETELGRAAPQAGTPLGAPLRVAPHLAWLPTSGHLSPPPGPNRPRSLGALSFPARDVEAPVRPAARERGRICRSTRNGEAERRGPVAENAISARKTGLMSRPAKRRGRARITRRGRVRRSRSSHGTHRNRFWRFPSRVEGLPSRAPMRVYVSRLQPELHASVLFARSGGHECPPDLRSPVAAVLSRP